MLVLTVRRTKREYIRQVHIYNAGLPVSLPVKKQHVFITTQCTCWFNSFLKSFYNFMARSTGMHSNGNKKLVRDIKDDNESSFEVLFEKYHRQLYLLALRYLRD